MNIRPLRHWQQAALSDYLKAQQRIYTCHATPASGKTQYGLAVAVALLKAAEIKQLTVLCHTKQIRQQWIDAARAVGISLSPKLYSDGDGYIFSYQQLVEPEFVERANTFIRGRRRSLVILDEPHHLAAARAWGSGTKDLLKYVHRILLLSGTLFRHDEGKIPFVTYTDGVLAPDFEYSYTDALKDKIVGPIYFPTFGGQTEWQFQEKQDAARFGETVSDRRLSHQLNTAISSQDWLGSVIRSADAYLGKIRKQAPTAGGLIVAKNQPHARAVAEMVEAITGTTPEIALSDIAKSEKVITAFARSDAKWIVAVKMISEGVDIPRLRVGVYASNILTELFFRQVVGRLVRTHTEFTRQDAYLYLPQHPVLLSYAQSIAEERYHTLSLEEQTDLSTRSVQEVFGQLTPGRAIAEAGEILDPLQLSPDNDLMSLLQSGFAALDAAEVSLQQARSYFQQVATALAASDHTASNPQLTISPQPPKSLSKEEKQLLKILAMHCQATISKIQLRQLSGLEKMRFYDCLAALKIEEFITIDDTDAPLVTEEGIAKLGNDVPAILRSGGDVIRLWSTVLTPRETELLEGLLKGHPQWLDRKSLLRLTSYKQSAAKRIGADLRRLVTCSLAESSASGEHRFNPNLLEIPFSGY